MLFWDRKDYVKKWYLKKDKCPFCKREDELILKETKYWIVLYNKYPYYGNKQNLLAVSKKHKKKTSELSLEEFKDLKNVEIFMEEYFKWKNYFSFIRQTEWWRSVEHLHYHYLEWVFYNKKGRNFNILAK